MGKTEVRMDEKNLLSDMAEGSSERKDIVEKECLRCIALAELATAYGSTG